MTYRDDHDALHARVQELERDLQKAQQDASEGHEARQRAEALAAALAKAQKELQQLRRPASAGPRRGPVLVVALAALIFAGGVAAVMMMRGTAGNERAAAEQEQAQAQAQSHSAKALEDARRMAEEARKEFAAAREKALAERARQEAETALRRTAPSLALKVKYPPGRAVWMASPQSATGVRVKGPCWLVAELVEKGLDSVELTCAKKVLYSSKDPLNGMQMGSRSLELSSRRLKLHYVDQGMRTGKRSQIAVNTPEKRVEVWRDADPAFRVRLSVPPFSSPLTSPPAEAAP